MAQKDSVQTAEVSVDAQTTTETAVETAVVAAAVTTKEIKTAPRERKFKLLNVPALTPKGKQRQIVLEILKEAKEPMSAAEVAKRAKPMGLQAVAGVEASVAWHLHQMTILKIVEIANPITTVELSTPTVEEKKEETIN